MKTIEEKAKAYDEIIEKANKMHHENCETCQMCIEELIPELREPDDERIRKEIKDFFSHIMLGQENFLKEDYDWNAWIAWIENQGDNRLMKALQEANKKIGELVEENYYLKEQDEQKHAWSKEDERIYQSIMDDTVQENQLDNKQINWLKSIKDRVLPRQKQKWSEEDEFNISELCSLITESYSKEAASGLRQWLKSLRPQNRWKPSDEQMEVLLSEVTAWTKGCPKQKVLESLYNDLKKLREE